MGLTDVAGVFSRYFVVGFFLPSFFWLLILSQTLSLAWLPDLYEKASSAAEVLVVGGAALLLGLLLLGFNWQIYRAAEGYPLWNRRDRQPFKAICDFFIVRERKRFDELQTERDDEKKANDLRANAASRLDYLFPERAAVLPSRFGNAIRAFESHAYKRWGLDTVAAWPRIEALLEDREAELNADARGEVAFFVNTALLTLASGLLLVGDQIANQPLDWPSTTAYLVPFLVVYPLYRGACGAAVRWGSAVRSSTDLHRLDLYEKLGVRRPINFEDERKVIAPAVNEALVYGYPIPKDLFATGETEKGS